MTESTHDGRRRAILAIDCATTQVLVASGTTDGVIDGLTTWPAGYRHGEMLVPTIRRFLGEQNIRRSRLTAIIVGTGPGAFTGLRVGIATAKGLAHGLRLPMVGISTAEALLAVPAMPASSVLLLPAGPSDRMLVRRGQLPVLLPAGTEPSLERGELLVAVDLDGRADPAAVALGETARAGLGEALIRLGAARLAVDDVDDLAGLVPEYVTLPRGMSGESGEVAWSRDPR